MPFFSDTNAEAFRRIDLPFGGRVARFISYWRSVTTDSWVLSTVEKGVSIPFMRRPTEGFARGNFVFNEASQIIESEVAALLKKGAIEEIDEGDARFLCGIFVIPKSSGGNRMIINLKPVNRFIETIHFKMVSLALLKDLVRKGDYFVKIDLTDAYLTIPLCREDRGFVQFSWNGKFYQFRTLYFGLAIAPWAFTKILKPVVAYLRSLGVRLIVYLDDILIINATKEGAEVDFRFAKKVLENCGFLVNELKSVAEATQTIEFLGTRPNSVTMRLTLKEGKLQQIKNFCNSAVHARKITLRDLSKILGNLSWAVQAVPYAQAHYRGLQAIFNNFYRHQGKLMDSLVDLDAHSLDDLSWWRDNILYCAGRPLEELRPDLIIFSDASLKGWGATMNDCCASGPWTTEHEDKHINELELLAAFNALRTFASNASNVSIHLMLDNATSVAYINKCGGTHSTSLSDLALEIIGWCELRHLAVQAFHVAGKDNVIADYHSRFHTDASDWRLDPLVFKKLQSVWEAKVDLFAANWNKQLDCFVSWKHQPDSLAIDALSLNWRWMRGYLFPPFCLIARCLSKILRDEADVTLVVPYWPTQPWFPMALELVCDVPRMLPLNGRLLTGPRGEPHPLLKQRTFRLIAWRLSGSASRREAFRQTCPIFSLRGAELALGELTNLHGDHGIAGVKKDRVIQWRQL